MDQLFKDILSQDTALWNLNHVMDAGTHNIWLLQAWRFSMSFHFFFLSYSERGRTAFFCNTYLHAIYIHCSRACGVDGITNLLMEWDDDLITASDPFLGKASSVSGWMISRKQVATRKSYYTTRKEKTGPAVIVKACPRTVLLPWHHAVVPWHMPHGRLYLSYSLYTRRSCGSDF